MTIFIWIRFGTIKHRTLPVYLVVLALSISLGNCTRASAPDGLSSVALLLSSPAPTPPGSGVNILSTPILVPAGGPPAPGEPHHAPDLNALITSTSPVSETSGLIKIKGVTFGQPVHNQTSITLFLGKRNMTLLPDNTVVNSLSNYSMSAGNVTDWYFGATADQKFKVLVVARNEFGISSKEVVLGHPVKCALALNVPVTIGNCAGHCIQATMTTGDTLELKGTFTPQEDSSYLSLSTDVASLAGFPVVPSNFVEDSGAGMIFASTSLKTSEWDDRYMCVHVSSLARADYQSGGSLLDGFLTGTILLP